MSTDGNGNAFIQEEETADVGIGQCQEHASSWSVGSNALQPGRYASDAGKFFLLFWAIVTKHSMSSFLSSGLSLIREKIDS